MGEKKIPIKNLYLITVICMGLICLGVGSTYAIFTTSAEICNPIVLSSNLTYTSNVMETISITVDSSKTVTNTFNINNTTDNSLNYIIYYIDEGLDIDFGTASGSPNGTLSSGNNTRVEVSIRNNTSSSVTVIMGVLSGPDSVVLGRGMTMVPNVSIFPYLTQYISNLYNNASKTVVTNNSIEYNYATSVNLMNDRLGGTTANYDAGNIRYYGAHADVNNYVDIGDRDSNGNVILYQIIGLFKDMEVTNDDGTTEVKDLVKVIRADSIGDYSYAFYRHVSGGGSNDYKYNDASFVMKFLSNNTNPEYEKRNKNVVTPIAAHSPTNDWTLSYLYDLLNPGHESELVGGSLWWNSQSGSCYTGYDDYSSSCDFTSTGLSVAAQSKISTVKWNLGGWNFSSIYSNQIYGYERGTTVYSSNATEWIGKVALMYPSDYGYATDFSKCSEKLPNYDSSTDSYACRSNDWLFNSADQWLLTHSSSGAERAWSVTDSGRVGHWNGVGNAYSVRPVFYLNSELVIESGTGSSSDPYKLG